MCVFSFQKRRTWLFKEIPSERRARNNFSSKWVNTNRTGNKQPTDHTAIKLLYIYIYTRTRLLFVFSISTFCLSAYSPHSPPRPPLTDSLNELIVLGPNALCSTGLGLSRVISLCIYIYICACLPQNKTDGV